MVTQLLCVVVCCAGAAQEPAPNERRAEVERNLASASSGTQRVYLLGKAARAALEAHDELKAGEYARKALTEAEVAEKDWNYGNVIHHANLVLGHLALSSGNVEEAKRRLLAAARTPGSPQLGTFGPNMTLAKELLQRGHRDVVLQFLEMSRKYWKRPERIEAWERVIREGGCRISVQI